MTEEETRAPIEYRDSADVGSVNFAQRLIELIAVPYEKAARVRYRGDTWDEMFSRGAFDGIEKRPNRVRANRDHDRTKVVGKALKFHPSREEGLVAEIRIAKTPLGDETLALADEDMLSASVGFGVRGRDQELDKSSRMRRIKRAFLDHIAFVSEPAYEGATVLSVRDNGEPVNAADLPRLATPSLDELLAWQRTRQS